MYSGLFCRIVLLLLMSGRTYSTPELPTHSEKLQTFQYTTPQKNNADIKGDQDDSELVNDMIKDVEELRNEDYDSDEKNDMASVPSYDDLENCSLPAALDRYCTDVPKEVLEYFKFDMSVSGLLASLFSKDIIATLQSSCSPGDWCLPDKYHQDILQGKALFYGTNPICSDLLWTCLEIMMDERMDCEEEKLSLLVDTVALICDIEEEEEYENENECYARTLETLYVTYSDMTRTAPVQETQLEQAGCSKFKVQMTKTYLCAHDVCNIYQKPLLEKFEWWEDIIESADKTAAVCHINRTCKPNNVNTDIPMTKENTDDEFENILEELEKEMEDDTDTENDNNKNVADVGTTDAVVENGNTMVIGIIVMTTVLSLGFVVMAFLGYRRFCRAGYGYDRWGYSKLIDEEAKLLRSEYS